MPVQFIDGEHSGLVVEALKIISREVLFNSTSFDLTKTLRDMLHEDVERYMRLLPLLGRWFRDRLLDFFEAGKQHSLTFFSGSISTLLKHSIAHVIYVSHFLLTFHVF